MAPSPKAPPGRGAVPRGQPVGRRASERTEPAAPGRSPRPTPKKGAKIRYSAVAVQEARGRRWVVGAVGVAASLLGMIGWSVYLAEREETASAPRGGPLGAATPSPSEPTVPSPAPAPRRMAAEPLAMTPRELRQALDQLGADVPKTSVGPYTGQEVTWTGRILGAVAMDGKIKIDLAAADGLRVTAWCGADTELGGGETATVRGSLRSRSPEGFVLDRCNLP